MRTFTAALAGLPAERDARSCKPNAASSTAASTKTSKKFRVLTTDRVISFPQLAPGVHRPRLLSTAGRAVQPRKGNRPPARTYWVGGPDVVAVGGPLDAPMVGGPPAL